VSALAKLYQSLVILDESLACTTLYERYETEMSVIGGQLMVRPRIVIKADPLAFDDVAGTWSMCGVVLPDDMAEGLIFGRILDWWKNHREEMTVEERSDFCSSSAIDKLRAVESAMKRLANK